MVLYIQSQQSCFYGITLPLAKIQLALLLALLPPQLSTVASMVGNKLDSVAEMEDAQTIESN